MKRYVRILLCALCAILFGFCLSASSKRLFAYLENRPILHLQPYNIETDEKLVTAKQIVSYLDREIEQNDKLNEYNWVLDSIAMQLNEERLGKVEVLYVLYGANRENLKILRAELDTKYGIFYGFSENGNKANDGTYISFDNWSVDSDEALSAAVKSLPQNAEPNLKIVTACADHLGWKITIPSERKEEQYEVRIDPHSGKVTDTVILP